MQQGREGIRAYISFPSAQVRSVRCSKVGRESGLTSLSLQHRSGPLAAHCQLSVVQLYGSASGNNMSAGWRILHAQIGISINHILRSDRLGVYACQSDFACKLSC